MHYGRSSPLSGCARIPRAVRRSRSRRGEGRRRANGANSPSPLRNVIRCSKDDRNKGRTRSADEGFRTPKPRARTRTLRTRILPAGRNPESDSDTGDHFSDVRALNSVARPRTGCSANGIKSIRTEEIGESNGVTLYSRTYTRTRKRCDTAGEIRIADVRYDVASASAIRTRWECEMHCATTVEGQVRRSLRMHVCISAKRMSPRTVIHGRAYALSCK